MATVYFGSAQTTPSNWNLTASWYSDPGISTCCCYIPGTPLGRLPVSTDFVVIYSGNVTTGPTGGFTSSNSMNLGGSSSGQTISAGTYNVISVILNSVNSTITGTSVFNCGMNMSPGSLMTGGTVNGLVIMQSDYAGPSTVNSYYYSVLSGGTVNGNVNLYGGWIKGSVIINGQVNIIQTAPTVSGSYYTSNKSYAITGGTIANVSFASNPPLTIPNQILKAGLV